MLNIPVVPFYQYPSLAEQIRAAILRRKLNQLAKAARVARSVA